MTHLLDFVTANGAFVILSWAGMLLCGIAAVSTVDKHCIVPHWLYQLSFIFIAFALGWGTAYGDDRAWTAWPPHLVLVIALDVFLVLRCVRAAVFFRRSHRSKAVLWTS